MIETFAHPYLFTTAKLQKQPRCPMTDEWILKMYIYPLEFYLAIKGMKLCCLQVNGWNLRSLMLSEVRQAHKNKG
jgi:hypothetical protein